MYWATVRPPSKTPRDCARGRGEPDGAHLVPIFPGRGWYRPIGPAALTFDAVPRLVGEDVDHLVLGPVPIIRLVHLDQRRTADVVFRGRVPVRVLRHESVAVGRDRALDPGDQQQGVLGVIRIGERGAQD